MEAIYNSLDELKKIANELLPTLQELKNRCEAKDGSIDEDCLERVLTLIVMQEIFIETVDGLKSFMQSNQE